MFNIASLETRRKYLKLITFYKIVNGTTYFPENTLTSNRPTRSSTACQGFLTIPFARTLSFQSSFILITVRLWNNLGVQYTNTSVNEYKYILRNVLL